MLVPENWLGDLDSNQDSQIQNLESYRWTISQQSGTGPMAAHAGKRQSHS